MSKPAIRAEKLSKKYSIQRAQAGYRTLRESITPAIFRGRKGSIPGDKDEVFALRDVSLEIERGTTVGLIGPNGAGKSTLLKILSRIIFPTGGRAEIRGRVGSLLEVGTGFHPELTGRENVYFNGSLLGMKKSEIDRYFDQIVSFAGTERFLDTPVKHYSTGMHTRLAFAVAAHLDTDILLVDEVLAVGDSAFQKKCLGRMNEVAKNGKTVVFVSHDLTNVAVLCESAVLLDGGTVRAMGPAKNVIEKYLKGVENGQRVARWGWDDAPGDETARITRIEATGATGSGGAIPLTEEVVLSIEYAVKQPARVNPVFVVKNAWGVTIFSTANYDDSEWGRKTHEIGCYAAQCVIPGNILNSGTFFVDSLIVKDTRHVLAHARQAIAIETHDEGSMRSDYLGEWVGVVRPRCAWETTRIMAGELVEAK